MLRSDPGNDKTFVLFNTLGDPVACGELEEQSTAWATTWVKTLSTLPMGAQDLQGSVVVHTTATGNGYGVLAVTGTYLDKLQCNLTLPSAAAGKECGIRIHGGAACATPEERGQFYYNWRKVRYSPKFDNGSHWMSEAGLPAKPMATTQRTGVTGFYVPNVGGAVGGRPLVIHDRAGVEVACGILGPAAPPIIDIIAEQMKLQKESNFKVGITTYCVLAFLALSVIGIVAAKITQAECQKCEDKKRKAARAKKARQPKLEQESTAPPRSNQASSAAAAAAVKEEEDALPLEGGVSNGMDVAPGDYGEERHVGLGAGHASHHLIPLSLHASDGGGPGSMAQQREVEMYHQRAAVQAQEAPHVRAAFPVAGFVGGDDTATAGARGDEEAGFAGRGAAKEGSSKRNSMKLNPSGLHIAL